MGATGAGATVSADFVTLSEDVDLCNCALVFLIPLPSSCWCGATVLDDDELDDDEASAEEDAVATLNVDDCNDGDSNDDDDGTATIAALAF